MTVFPDIGFTGATVILALLSGGLLAGNGWWGAIIPACAVFAALVLRDFLCLRRYAPTVQVTLTVPSSRQRGEPLQAAVRVSNPGPQHADVSVRVLLPAQGRPSVWQQRLQLKPGTETEVSCVVETPVRGLYEFKDVYIRMNGPGRMLRAQRRLAHTASCKVYPDVKRVHEYLASRRLHLVNVPHLRRTPLRGVGSEFEGLRDYETGDDIRRIDWKATAKHRRLITRNYEIESFRNVLVMVDRGRLMAAQAGRGAKLDYAIDAALLISAVALEGGDRAGVLVFDKEVSAYLPPRGSLSCLPGIIEALYAVPPILEESDFLRAFVHLQARLTQRSLVVALTDVIDADASRSLMEGMLALNKRHLVICAALRTPAVYDVIAAPAASPLDPYRKAAAYRLVKERSDVIARLRKGGVHVLDVMPDQLTIPLVNKYIEIREQNRL